jgi:hypothetical protein
VTYSYKVQEPQTKAVYATNLDYSGAIVKALNVLYRSPKIMRQQYEMVAPIELSVAASIYHRTITKSFIATMDDSGQYQPTHLVSYNPVPYQADKELYDSAFYYFVNRGFITSM